MTNFWRKAALNSKKDGKPQSESEPGWFLSFKRIFSAQKEFNIAMTMPAFQNG